MINKLYREIGELQGLFADPRYYRQAWKSVGNAILMNPATKPVYRENKDGDETYESKLENYTYAQLSNDLKTIVNKDGKGREPTELEMILACQAIRARTDTSAAVFIRDTLGAKPVDESKVDQTVTNAYDTLSDEELQLIADLRHKREAEKARQEAEEQLRANCKPED